MKQKILNYVVFMVLACSVTVFAQQSSIALPLNKQSEFINIVHDCAKETLGTTFTESIVRNVLIQDKIPLDQAEKIAQELSKKDEEVVELAEKKIGEAKQKLNLPADMKQSDVNQLNSYREAMQSVLKEASYEVFANILNTHGITDETRIHQLLDNIQRQQIEAVKECVYKRQDFNHTNIQK